MRDRVLACLCALGFVGALTAPAAAASARVAWRFTPTATQSTLSAVDVVDRSVVWASGGGFASGPAGSIVRTVNGGRTWQNITPPGGAGEEFRDVEAFDRDHAVVLALANTVTGSPAQVYRTTDGGATWRVAYQSPDATTYYTCMAFFDRRHGLVVSDPVNGRFPLLVTDDGGRTWKPAEDFPPALPGEATRGSGTCLTAIGPHDAWFGTDNPNARARVLHTQNRGKTWTAATTPIPGYPAGILSVAFRDRRHGLAVGGALPEIRSTAAGTSDAGRTWTRAGAPHGFRTGVAWIPGFKEAAVMVGVDGSDVSFNGGRTWTLFDRTPLLGVDCLPHVACWTVGEKGLAGELTRRHH
ncbi:WD40/YVTN/BNR-like repeat-containing protein [Spirillospora sp. NPDC048911]|uniref:WD40/YVTN/BNR-like repeat-containing protein n=1 Tax=Spirillospora sp. NPDC048911 TaxID=3364527 RepID=UPI003719BC96